MCQADLSWCLAGVNEVMLEFPHTDGCGHNHRIRGSELQGSKLGVGGLLPHLPACPDSEVILLGGADLGDGCSSDICSKLGTHRSGARSYRLSTLQVF